MARPNKDGIKWALEDAIQDVLNDYDWDDDDEKPDKSTKIDEAWDTFCQIVLDTARGNGPKDERAMKLLEDLRAL